MRSTVTATPLSTLIGENAGLIMQGGEVVESIPPEVYANNVHPQFKSGAGKHFRHILDFYDRLLSGWRGTIDYDCRTREARIEQDAAFAAETDRQIVSRLHDVETAAARSHAPGNSARGSIGGTPVTVRSEIRDANNNGLLVQSSLERELANLASHTVHHYALIALVLRLQGHETPKGFGIAPSTLRYMAAADDSG